jgi:hypothetical protein
MHFELRHWLAEVVIIVHQICGLLGLLRGWCGLTWLGLGWRSTGRTGVEIDEVSRRMEVFFRRSFGGLSLLFGVAIGECALAWKDGRYRQDLLNQLFRIGCRISRILGSVASKRGRL